MSLDKGTLLGIAHAERQRLGRMIQFAGPATWDLPSAAPGWWNRDVMAHLAAADTAAAQLVAGEPAQELEEYRESLGDRPFDLDAYNAGTVNRRSGLTTREVLTLWGQAADSFLAHAARLSDAEWSERRFSWVSGEIAARYLVQSRIVEWWLHGEDIRATNGLGPQYEHWPIYLTVDLGVRMLPWALARDAVSLAGRTVRIDLEGAGQGSWHWGLGAGEVPGAGHEPDAWMKGRAPQFALVAGKRLDPDDVLASGSVSLGGDIALAELVLRTITAYA
ncbi:MAG: hypothetical protein QOE83_1221 [Actinomycetota bacterium]|nr:hypothetical protein [Actinomycetota bacterium]